MLDDEMLDDVFRGAIKKYYPQEKDGENEKDKIKTYQISSSKYRKREVKVEEIIYDIKD